MTFGEKLQALRKARGWSQEGLATQINVSRQALSKWESGASVPDTENVVALSRLFGVSTDYLLLENGETTAQAAPTAAPSRQPSPVSGSCSAPSAMWPTWCWTPPPSPPPSSAAPCCPSSLRQAAHST